MRILVVEDEPALREGLVDLLAGAGHEVSSTGDGLSAVEMATAIPYELLVLDLRLPRLDGIEVARRLRLPRPGVLILMLTALGSEDDKVEGLLAGADDYVTKPFGARELLARVSALGRRLDAAAATPELLEVDGCSIDLGRLTARRGERSVSLTAREAGILRWLYHHRSRAVTRADLLVHIWGLRGDLETRTVDVTIANLRAKIERDPRRPAIVVAVKGVGYAWAIAKDSR